jgi:CheY-like chemotaxis protein
MAWHEVRQRARLVKDYGGALPLVGNESRMSQVFLNLVINAAQAIEPGSAEQHEIRIWTGRGGDGQILVEVRDTGSGIPPEVQRRLFTPFVTTKPVGSGTGLGLAICQRIVSGAGGEITFTTELGKGTTFRVRLPSGDTNDGHAMPSPAQRRTSTQAAVAANTAPQSLRGRVLAIDDDAMVLQSLRRILGRSHHIVCEERATIALGRIVAGEEFDVILCDLMMPEMDGVAFCTALEKVNPRQAKRLVFLTGGAVNPEAHDFLDRSENVRLDKPFDLAMLRALVARYID